MNTTTVFKASVATALIALYGAAGLALASAPAAQPAQYAQSEIVHLERVVIIGHRTHQVAQVEYLPRVVIVGHRSVDGVQMAKACTQSEGNC